jgi:hypothetical protein
MPAAMTEPILMPVSVASEPSEGSMKAQLWGLLSAMYPDGGLPERRRQERFPYPRLVYLNPVAADGQTPLGNGLVVAGKHISERGLGFYHPTPLPYRWVVASLEKGPDEWLSLLLDVSWCRFSRRGWYESGGRFLRAVAWPKERLARCASGLSSHAG